MDGDQHSQATKIDLGEKSGTGLHLQAGGRENLGFTKKDLPNYLNTKRQRDLVYGDAGRLMLYFEKRQCLNPSFMYSVQMDNEDKITNIFWADPRMRFDYELFGDVVVFNTTFCTNREYRPFSVFAGLNHHKGAVIFGVALLYDQTIESFRWLFETFFRVNGEKRPKTFFTDQDDAMARAIAEVSPSTRHAFCTWHIWQNAKKHLRYLMHKGSPFYIGLQKCIWDYEEVDEFENAWKGLRENYGIHNTNWLDRTYALKAKWACCYMKDVFTIGVRSTQLAKSINADLRQCLKPKYDLLQFLDHFQVVVDGKRAKELKKEFDARNSVLGSSQSKIPMVNQAYRVYTPDIFKEFMEEFDLIYAYFLKSHNANHEYAKYVISLTDEHGCSIGKEYKILHNLVEQSMTCSCKKFESFGILCSHVMRVLDLLQVKCIPDKYILMRWNKTIRELSMDERRERKSTEVNDQLSHSQRYRMICPIFLELINQACKTEAGNKILCDKLIVLRKELQDLHNVEPIEHISKESVETYGQFKKKEHKKVGSKRHMPWHEKVAKNDKKKTPVEGQSSIEVSSSGLPSSVSTLGLHEGLKDVPQSSFISLL